MTPSFFLIGAMKAGTTSVYRYLAQHPQIFLPKLKEPNFYWIDEHSKDCAPAAVLRESTVTREAYDALYDGAAPGQVCGEGSVKYLTSPLAASRIAADRPDACFVLILRDPAARAWSHYTFSHERGVDACSDFGRALEQEEERLKLWAGYRYGYLRGGMYHRHLSVYDELFPRDRFCVQLYEDLTKDPHGVLRTIFEHLGVDPSFEPDMSIRHNVTGRATNPLVDRLVKIRRLRTAASNWIPPGLATWLGRTLRERPPGLKPEHRAWIIERCRTDVLRLQDRIDRDLSHWLR